MRSLRIICVDTDALNAAAGIKPVPILVHESDFPNNQKVLKQDIFTIS
jgi:hypothetical protein